MNHQLDVTNIAEQMLEKLDSYSVSGDITPNYIKKEKYNIVGWIIDAAIDCIKNPTDDSRSLAIEENSNKIGVILFGATADRNTNDWFRPLFLDTCKELIPIINDAGLLGYHLGYLSCKTDVTSDEPKWTLVLSVL